MNITDITSLAMPAVQMGNQYIMQFLGQLSNGTPSLAQSNLDMITDLSDYVVASPYEGVAFHLTVLAISSAAAIYLTQASKGADLEEDTGSEQSEKSVVLEAVESIDDMVKQIEARDMENGSPLLLTYTSEWHNVNSLPKESSVSVVTQESEDNNASVSLWNKVRDVFSTTWRAICDASRSIADRVASTSSKLENWLKSFFITELPSSVCSCGENHPETSHDIESGLKNGNSASAQAGSAIATDLDGEPYETLFGDLFETPVKSV